MAKAIIKKKENNEIVVFEKGQQFWTTSMDVALNFEKRHDNVLSKIDDLIKELSQKDVPYFKEIFSSDSYGREQRMYEITRDGFSLLVMGFTGKKALTWKLKYINAFNALERQLIQNTKRKGDEVWRLARENGKKIRIEQTDIIKKFVEYAKTQGSTKAEMYYMAITKMENQALFYIIEGMPKPNNLRDVLETFQLFHLGSADRMIAREIEKGMEKNLHYKDIFQIAKRKIEQFADMVEMSPIMVKSQTPLLI